MRSLSCFLAFFFMSLFFYSDFLLAAPKPGNVPGSAFDKQAEYEREIQAVVRNKFFYKSDRVEVSLTGGVMPYDSLVNHYMFGGKFSWHLSDHYGWEVIDAQFAIPTVTSFTTNLVQDRGISNLQSIKLRQIFTTNFLLSPLYGKIRFFGSQILFFDVYFVLGGGLANTETFQLATAQSGVAGTESVIRTGLEPALDFGIGFKIFVNQVMGVVIDLRDYVVYSETYGKKSPKSNFSVFGGLTFFLPTF